MMMILTWGGHCECVSVAVSNLGAVCGHSCGADGDWIRQDHGVIIYPQLANIGVSFAECVDAWIRI